MLTLEGVLEVDFDCWDYLHFAVKGSEGLEEDFFDLMKKLGVDMDELEYLASEDQDYIEELKEKNADDLREAIIENAQEEEDQQNFLRDMENYWIATR